MKLLNAFRFKLRTKIKPLLKQMLKEILEDEEAPHIEEAIELVAQKETKKMALEPVKEFLESYIGVLIVGFESVYEEGDDDEEYEDIVSLSEDVEAKMITAIGIKDNKLWAKLSKMNGKSSGYLIMEPTANSLFQDITWDEEPTDESVYRFMFYGGRALEYSDSEGEGFVYYSDTLPSE